MCAAALQQAQLDAANLAAQLVLNGVSQHGSQTAELCMAEAIGSRGLSLGYEGAVSVVNTLGNSYQAVALLVVDALYVSQELLHVEVGLRQVNQIRTCAQPASQRDGP